MTREGSSPPACCRSCLSLGVMWWTERPVLHLPLDGCALSGHPQSALQPGCQCSCCSVCGQMVNVVLCLWAAASPQGNQRPVRVAIRVIVKRRTNVQRNDGVWGRHQDIHKRKTDFTHLLSILKTGKPHKKTFPRIFNYFLLHLFEFPKDSDEVPHPYFFKKWNCHALNRMVFLVGG